MLKVDYVQSECLAKFGKDPRVYQTTVKEVLKDDAGNLTGAIISYLKPERNPCLLYTSCRKYSFLRLQNAAKWRKDVLFRISFVLPAL